MEDVNKPNDVNGNPTVTPTNAGGNNPQSGGMKVEDLAKRIEEMEKRLSDKDAHITELANEKATLEQRLSNVGTENRTEGVPPVEGNFVRADQIPVILKQQMYVERIREDNKDLIDLGLEPSIELRARQFLSGGKDFETSISLAVKEHREKVEKLKTPVKQPVPSGAVGEDGGVKAPIEPKKEPEPQMEDEGLGRFERRSRLGL